MGASLRYCDVMNDWIKSLQKVRLNNAETVPSGWMTLTNLQDVMNLGYAQTYKNVEALCKQGLAEKKKFQVQCGTFVRGRFHYRLK